LGQYGELRLGLEFGHLHARDKTNLNLYEFKGYRGGYNGRLNLDMMEAASFSRYGYRLQSRIFLGDDKLGSDLTYTKAEVKATWVNSWNKNSFFVGTNGGSSLGTDLPEFEFFTLGGPEGLEGFRAARLRGQTYVLGALGWYRKIKGHPSPYSTSWYVGAKIEAGNAWRELEHARMDDLHLSASVSLAIDTIVGPFRLAYSRADTGDDAVSVSLGRLVEFLE